MKSVKNYKKSVSKFYCDFCDYGSNNTQHFSKHLTTRKHQINELAITSHDRHDKKCETLKINNPLYCSFCDYLGSTKQNFLTHLKTNKHQIYGKFMENNKLINMGVKKEDKLNNKTYTCKQCNKGFMSSSGLYRHNKKQTCVSIISNKLSSVLSETKSKSQYKSNSELLNYLINETSNLRQTVIELSSAIPSRTFITNNTNTNNTFNLQIFLNETCKDAINITDFIENIKISLQDVETVGDKGYFKYYY